MWLYPHIFFYGVNYIKMNNLEKYKALGGDNKLLCLSIIDDSYCIISLEETDIKIDNVIIYTLKYYLERLKDCDKIYANIILSPQQIINENFINEWFEIIGIAHVISNGGVIADETWDTILSAINQKIANN